MYKYLFRIPKSRPNQLTMHVGLLLLLFAMVSGNLDTDCGYDPSKLGSFETLQNSILAHTTIHVWVSNSTDTKFIGLKSYDRLKYQRIGYHFGFGYSTEFNLTLRNWPVDIDCTPYSQGLMRDDKLKISDSVDKSTTTQEPHTTTWLEPLTP
jgi:hypothetical protein